MQHPPLGIAILGLGEGYSALSAVLGNPRWNLRWLCDLDPALLERRQREFGTVPVTTDYAQVLADPTVDVVAVYTPDHLHARHIAAALTAGKHVVCTKPLFDDLAEAKQVLELAQRAGRQVLVGQSTRFGPAFLSQRRDVERGLLGRIETVESYYHHDHRGYHTPKVKERWGAEGLARFDWIFGGMSHCIDLVRLYLPRLRRVYAQGTLSDHARGLGFANPDAVHAVFTTDDGRTARASGVYCSPMVDEDRLITCSLRGSRAGSDAQYPEFRYRLRQDGVDGLIDQRWREQHLYYYRFGGHTSHAGEYQNYLDYFADRLHAGLPAHPGLAEGIATMAVMLAVQRSVRSGQPVDPADLLAEAGLPSGLLDGPDQTGYGLLLGTTGWPA